MGCIIEKYPNTKLWEKLIEIEADVLAVSSERLKCRQNSPSLAGTGETIRFSISIVDSSVGPIAEDNIVAGTYDLIRIRNSVETTIVNDGAFSKRDGFIYIDIDFDSATWDLDDTFMLIPNQDSTAQIGGTIYHLPLSAWSGMILDLAGIESSVNTLISTIGTPAGASIAIDIADIEAKLDDGTHGLAALNADLDAILADSKYIFSTALIAPTVNSLTKFIASGGTSLGTTLGASKSLVDAIGADGAKTLSHDFSEAGLMQYAHGKHLTTYILFIIPEAVAAINAHNTAIKASLERLGRVLVITQADALSYPDFNTYTLFVLGTNNGTAWNTANLAHIKEISDMPVVCCDSVSAAYLEMGTANANVVGTKVLNGVSNIEGSIVGMGLHGRTGLAVGAQDLADINTTFASLDMSDADITEVYYGYETLDDNAHVLLGKIRFIQPDGTIGVDEEGAEVPGARYFYGPAYSFSALNTLGKDAFEILVLGFIHSKTIGHSIAISGEIRSLEKVLFGNLKNKFSNSNPLAKFIGTGGTGLGQPLPASTSLVDVIGDFTGPHDGAAQDDNIKASLDLLHTNMDRQEHVSFFRSDLQASVTLDNTGTTDVTLPSVTIPVNALPAGHTFGASYCHLKYGSRKDTSTADNAIVGNQHVQVQDSAAPGYTNAILIVNNALPIDVSEATVMGGDVVFGNIEVSSTVDAENKTYNFQWTDCQVTANNMILYDVQTIIEVRWH